MTQNLLLVVDEINVVSFNFKCFSEQQKFDLTHGGKYSFGGGKYSLSTVTSGCGGKGASGFG